MKRDLAQRVAAIEAEGQKLDDSQEKDEGLGKDFFIILGLIFLAVLLIVAVNLLPTIIARLPI